MKKRVRIFDSIVLREVSPVGIPSYRDAVHRSLFKSLNEEDTQLNQEENKMENETEVKQEAVETQPEIVPEQKPAEEVQEQPKEEIKEEPKEEVKEEKAEVMEKSIEQTAIESKDFKEMLVSIIKEEVKNIPLERGLVEKNEKTKVSKSIGELTVEFWNTMK